MAARDVLKNCNLFVDGRGYAGQVEEMTPPALTLVTEEFKGGGMNAPVEITMGMEKLNSMFSLISYDRDVLSLFGVAEGNQLGAVIRGALESFDGAVKSVIHTMRGKIKKIDPGTWKPGEKAPLAVEMALRYYKQEVNGATIHEIDVENMVCVVNGIDQLAAQRVALGI